MLSIRHARCVDPTKECNRDPKATILDRGQAMAIHPHHARTATAAGLLVLLLAAPAAWAQAPLAAEGCLGCHGPGGSGSGAIPALAGRDVDELRALMAAFRANERPATIMDRIVRGYTEAEIAAVTEHFARQPR
jgi:sulfide dehydrogenase cytochrome subunit